MAKQAQQNSGTSNTGNMGHFLGLSCRPLGTQGGPTRELVTLSHREEDLRCEESQIFRVGT